MTSSAVQALGLAAECGLILAEARKNPGLVTQCGLWRGGSPACDFYPDSPDQDGMHPHGWHSWIGYGNGSIGNLGMDIMDVAPVLQGEKKTQPASSQIFSSSIKIFRPTLISSFL